MSLRIQSKMQELSPRRPKLSLKINGIWDIVNLIDNMAEQTKIIAFNAELVSNTMKDETFKNVASEIRNLADSVMTLTGQIRKKISEIQDSAQELIDSGKNCMKKIEEGNILSNLLREHFETINNSASITAEETESITGSIQTQISAFKMILISMDRIYEALKKHASANTISAIETLRTNSAHIEQLVPEEAEL